MTCQWLTEGNTCNFDGIFLDMWVGFADTFFVMKKSQRALLFMVVVLGLFVGGLLAASRDGQISFSSLFAASDRSAGSVTPVCNPVPVAAADLDGELPGGG